MHALRRRVGLTLLAVITASTLALAGKSVVQSTGSAVAAQASAAPISAVDESKVPHYFGPYPNWANSPQVLANAIVTISNGGGLGRRGDGDRRSEDGRHHRDHRHEPGQRLHHRHRTLPSLRRA